MNHILFICTGNYYRSRFAEAVFNHGAEERGIDWRAFSRGLRTHLVFGEGDLSIYTRFALAARGIDLRHTGERPQQLTEADLRRSKRIIALKDEEHRPMFRAMFPAWENKAEFWQVHDLDFAMPDEAIPMIERRTLSVLDALDGSGTESHQP